MSRVLLQYLLPLLLPTLLYLIWWWAAGRHRTAATAAGPSRLAEGPWFWLIVGGCLLMGAALVYTALTTGSVLDGRYVPPSLHDGRVVPGHIERTP